MRGRSPIAIVTALGLATAIACGSLQSAEDAPTANDAGAADATTDDASAVRGDAASIDAGDAGTYVREVLADGPRLYYRLGEDAGTSMAYDFLDPAGATAGQHVQTKRPVPGALLGDPDTAAGFDGKTSSVFVGSTVMPSFDGTSPFTIELWVKPTKAPTDFQHLVTKQWNDGDGREGYALFIEATKGFALERYVAGNNKKAVVQAPPATDRFTHVVATYDGTVIKVFVDGVLGAIEADTSPFPAPPAIDAPSGHLGCGQDCNDKFFDGVIDEVAFYDFALSESRIVAHHLAGTR